MPFCEISGSTHFNPLNIISILVVVFFSQKLGPSVDIQDYKVENLFEIFLFAMIADENFITAVLDYLDPINYAFDIFPDNFGEHFIRYNLISN